MRRRAAPRDPATSRLNGAEQLAEAGLDIFRQARGVGIEQNASDFIQRKAASRRCKENIHRSLPDEVAGWVRFFRIRGDDANGPEAAQILRFEQSAQYPADLLELRQHLARGAHVAIGIDVEGADVQLCPALVRVGDDANRQQKTTSEEEW
jgi:hypothetical protein